MVFDHVPLLFQIRDQIQTMRGFKRPFKFENVWTKDDSCSKVVEERWKKGTIDNFKDLARSVAKCGDYLAKWNKENYGNLQNQIKAKQKKLVSLLTMIRGIE